jgi:hypothetical protein
MCFDTFLLSQDPMLRGLVAQRDFFDMQKFGTELAAKDKYITAAAHLYHAAKSKGLLGKEVVWKDLEYMVEKLGDGLDFNCQRPQNDFHFHQDFRAACGYSTIGKSGANRITRSEARETDAKLSRGMNRKLQLPSRYAYLCTEINGESLRTNNALANTEELFKLLSTEETKRSSSAKRRIYGPKDTRGCPTLVESLTSFRKAMQQDSVAFRFNIVSLWLTCRMLLRSIQSKEHIVDGDTTHLFLQKHLLHWLEAMSLMRDSSQCFHLLDCLQVLPEVSSSRNIPLLLY